MTPLPIIKKYRFSLCLTALIGTYLVFGIHHIGQFITADEHYWVEERVPQYWQAIRNHKWTKTFINDKPGVSLALIDGPSFALHPEAIRHCDEAEDKMITCNQSVTDTGSLYAAFRIPILFLNAFFLIILCVLISQIAGPWVALLTTALTAFSPIILGVSQIINPDALLWSCGTIGIFSFLAYLEKREWKYIAITIIATGFALLSKYAAIILIPTYMLFAALFFLLRNSDHDNTEARRWLLTSARSIGLIALGSIAILCFFLPALLLNDKYIHLFLETIPHKGILSIIAFSALLLFIIDTFLLKNVIFFRLRDIIRKSGFLLRSIPLAFLAVLLIAIATRIVFPEWEIYSKIPFDMKNFINARYYGVTLNPFETFILEWQPIIFSQTPVALLGLLAFFTLPPKPSDERYRFFSIAIPLFAVTYISIFLVSDVLVTPRYSILLYPLFAFLAALGLDHIATRFQRYHYAQTALTMLILVASLLSLLSVRPFYFNYSNFLLPKNSLISDSWGYGGYEAAQYLNSLPDAKDLTVWSDYYGVCEFFVGRCLTAYTFDKETIKPDYYILTRRGGIRYMSRWDRWEEKSGLIAYKYYGAPDPAWQLSIDGRSKNFVKVVKVR
jgi:4-amino-4-deoxy-L-arabinose transferase-like glycosyltransferase